MKLKKQKIELRMSKPIEPKTEFAKGTVERYDNLVRILNAEHKTYFIRRHKGEEMLNCIMTVEECEKLKYRINSKMPTVTFY